jgi:hypothetical protein
MKTSVMRKSDIIGNAEHRALFYGQQRKARVLCPGAVQKLNIQ